MPSPPLGMSDLMQRAQQGDPNAIETLQQLGVPPPGGGAGVPPGMAPPGGMPAMGPSMGGGMPPGGAPGGAGMPPSQSVPPAMIQKILGALRGGGM